MTTPVEAAAATSAAAVESFEAQVALKSTRNGNPSFAVGYYVSLRLLLELNARSPSPEQVDKDALLQVVQSTGNARMFKRSSFVVHERVDGLVLDEINAYTPTTLERSERTRLQQVAKRANHTKFCKRMNEIAPNGDKLLSRLQWALASVVVKYSSESGSTEAKPDAAGADETLELTTNSRATLAPIATASPHARVRKISSLPRSLPRAVGPVFPVLQVHNATVDGIRRETSVLRAYEILQKYPPRFTAYRVFFKNDHMKLAIDISRCCMDKLIKTEIRQWIRTKIGSIPVYSAKATSGHKQQPSKDQKCARTRPSAFFNWELRHLALVAAALTVYGEHVLSALYDTHAMKQMKDIPLVSDEVRDASKQKLCLQRARMNHNGLNMSGAYHAAHYLPLDLTIQWNNALSPELRLSAKDLSMILNLQCNMKAVRKRVNIKDHRKVEHFIAAFIKQSGTGGSSFATPKCASWLVWRNTKDRLEQIARRVQSKELRTAFLGANGQGLYALIERTFQQIEGEFARRGFDFGKIWDWQEEDKADGNTSNGCPALCELLRAFTHSTLELNKQMDTIILAASDNEHREPLDGAQRKRIYQIRKHAMRTERVKHIENGGKLLKRIQDRLDAVTATYPTTSSSTTRSKARAKVSANAVTPEQAKPGVKTATTKSKPGKAASADEATIDSIKSETGCHRAYELFLSDLSMFTFCRVYIKNTNINLAKEILRRCKCKKKTAIRKWIREYVGPIPVCKAVRSGSGNRDRTSRRVFFIWELRDLALVAAALAVYGETELSALLDSKSLEVWQKIASVPDECRDNCAQAECLKRAGVSNMHRTYHAAHYLGLDLAIRWNNSLAPEYRLSAECFYRILNFQCNLKAVRRSVNVKDHSKAESLIALFIKHGGEAELEPVTRVEARNIWDRLVETAKKVQSQEIRDALVLAGGQKFYLRVKQTFEEIEARFAQRGFHFGKLWDQRADSKARRVARQLWKKELKIVVDERHEIHTEEPQALEPELLD